MVTLCAPSLAVPSLRLLFYCKLDVKNDALINLADNLKTKGLPPRHLTPTPVVPLSRIKIQDAKLPINEGWDGCRGEGVDRAVANRFAAYPTGNNVKKLSLV